MDWKGQKEYLDQLFSSAHDNISEIIRIYKKIIEDTNYSASDEVIKYLNQNGDQLLSTKVADVLKKNRLDAYSYLLVANDLLDLDDVKTDLLGDDVLANAVPPNALRKLKSHLGLVTADSSTAQSMQEQASVVKSKQLTTTSVREKIAHTQHHGESLAMASTYSATVKSVQHKQPAEPKEPKESTTVLAVAQPQHDIHHGGTNDNGNRLAIKIKEQCKFLERLKGDMFSHYIDLKETTTFTNTSSIIKRFSLGDPNKLMNKTCKTILLMGETGSGKTTMINAMVNYVLGVELEDNFRFKLIREEVTGGSQAHSQTQGVTAYDLHYQKGFRIPFSLTIVDTPGFGDTRGGERDKEITASIKEFFENENGIQELDAVGFVVKSSDVRLTLSQKYIFDSVLSIFGKDMGENIRFLVTWADGGDSQVLAAIKEAQLPCQVDSNGLPCHYNFNNDAVYTKPSNNVMSSCKWEMSMENFESFFRELNGMKTKSLQMTKEVLEMRECLKVQLEFLWNGIDQQLAKIEECRRMEEIIARNKEKIDSNQNFEMTVTVSKKVKDVVEKSQSALNCKNCEVTCHYPCSQNLWTNFCPAFWEFSSISAISLTALRFGKQMFFKNKEKFDDSSLQVAPVDPLAVAFEAGKNLLKSNRTCKVCPGKCPSADHVNENSRWVYKEVEEKKTLFNVRKQYEDAKGQKATAEGTLTNLKEDMEKLKSEILKAMEDITICSNMLKSIALRGTQLTTAEYIQLKIENEKKENKRGYEQRIDILEDILKTAKENLNKGATTSH